ncbi:MerR family transcriptional regulator [Paenibacillus sp. YPG26]|uniref:MerR family transcriptional regulator n=1 Tax=Paenibacillus sp. YPG26 TaxID=2878915 RepID=UPI0020408745|nr:MerR family transcriptional regulator [Paenibacillus sp. YPG26]USB33507.1 MerR family transcriptional regulator [Paenibacillus sp. YPG26]
MSFRSKELAEKYGLSASTLRNYEAKGLLPPAERSAGGYRIYTERHEAYLACIHAMAAAFGIEITGGVMHCLRRNELGEALWIVRDREVKFHQEKEKLDQLIGELRLYSEGGQAYDLNQQFSIHEASRRTGAPKSAIRYWEECGLLTTDRNPENRYRLYGEAHLFKIGLIQTLQSALYSNDTISLKQSIASLDLEDTQRTIQLADNIHAYLNRTIKLQVKALYFLHRLVDLENID